MAELPSGTVTFLFTDVEGSTKLLASLHDRYADVLADQAEVGGRVMSGGAAMKRAGIAPLSLSMFATAILAGLVESVPVPSGSDATSGARGSRA